MSQSSSSGMSIIHVPESLVHSFDVNDLPIDPRKGVQNYTKYLISNFILYDSSPSYRAFVSSLFSTST